MKKAVLILACGAVLGCTAGVPVKWTVETSRADERVIDVYHGESLDMEVTFKSYGQILELPTNEVAGTFWQTNGMDTAYWRTNDVEIVASNGIMRTTFGPEKDVGAKTLRGFIGIPGQIYRAAFVLRFKDAPGYNTTIVEWPYRDLDFDKIEVRNAPYYTKDETDEKLDAIGEMIGEVSTNFETAVGNEHQYAQGISNKMQIAINQINGKLVDDVILKEGWNNLDSVLHLTRRGQYNRPIISMSANKEQYEGNTHYLDIALDYGGNWYFNVWDDDEEYDTSIDIPRKNGTMALTDDIDYSTSNVQLAQTIQALSPPGDYTTNNATMVETIKQVVTNEEEGAWSDWQITTDPQMPEGWEFALEYEDGSTPGAHGTGWFLRIYEGDFSNLIGEGFFNGVEDSTNLVWTVGGNPGLTIGDAFRNEWNNGTLTAEKKWERGKNKLGLATSEELADEVDAAKKVAQAVDSRLTPTVALIANQVSVIGASLNAEDAKFEVTNYNSVTKMPEASFSVRVLNTETGTNEWIKAWDEMTRWNSFLMGTFAPFTNEVETALANKSEKEYAFYDGVTGNAAPEGYFWISQPYIAIAAGMAYQRYVESGNEVWILESNGMVADLNGTTNGYFRVTDEEGNTQFEIIKGNRVTLAAAPFSMHSEVMGVTHWFTEYQTTNAVAQPTARFSREIGGANEIIWIDETDASCPCNVSWTDKGGGLYEIEWWPKADEPKMFMQATYEAGGSTRIVNNATVEMTKIMIGGVEYTLGSTVINGKRVLTLE